MHEREAISRLLIATLISFCTFHLIPARADGPSDNQPDNVRRVPPPGIEIPEAGRSSLQARLAVLVPLFERIGVEGKKPGMVADLAPDVEIFQKAVKDALAFNEFYDAREIAAAERLLDECRKRAEALLQKNPYWLQQTGLVVRGYRSKIDGSVQPYGLVIPKTYPPARLTTPARPLGFTVAAKTQ